MDEVNHGGTLSFPHNFSRNLQLFQNKKPAGRPPNDRVPVMAPPPLTIALLLPGVALLVGVLLLGVRLLLGCALLVPRLLLAVL